MRVPRSHHDAQQSSPPAGHEPTLLTRRSLLRAVPALAAAGATTGALTACQSESPQSIVRSEYTVVTDGTVTRADQLGAPTGPPVLTVSGAIANATGPMRFDLDMLESLGTVEYTANDRLALGRDVTFQGVLLARLLAVLGADRASTVHARAVNDFEVDIPVSDTARYAVMLATRADGRRMSVEEYGPVRVVYPTRGTTLDPVVYDARWIWQLVSLEVRG